MQIHGFNKTTLLDYPGHLAATIFLGGCNMRCPFCHNASLVTNLSTQTIIPENDIYSILDKRKNILEGVCITGGEPTLNPALPQFIEKIKSFGLKVKLDTNGTNPVQLHNLVKNKLIDYVAMDIKNSKEKYFQTSGLAYTKLQLISDSISLLLEGALACEFRTTLVKELHTREDMISIGEWIRGADNYYLQSYLNSGDIISPGLSSHTTETLKEYAFLLTPYVKHVSLRGVE
jgi:pyruvate formate lyase activating enzyme